MSLLQRPEGTGGVLPGRAPRSPRRPWSPRRVPAALVAACLAALTGTLVYGAVAGMLGTTPAWAWDRIGQELTRRPWNDAGVRGLAALAALAGLLLMIVALSPGRRRLHRLDAGDTQMGAYLTRRALGLLLRDAAQGTPGVAAARVKVRRRRIAVRAEASFRDVDELDEELTARLRQRLAALGLARPPRLGVRLRGQLRSRKRLRAGRPGG